MVSHTQKNISYKRFEKGAKIHHCPAAVSSALKPSGLSKILRMEGVFPNMEQWIQYI